MAAMANLVGSFVQVVLVGEVGIVGSGVRRGQAERGIAPVSPTSDYPSTAGDASLPACNCCNNRIYIIVLLST